MESEELKPGEPESEPSEGGQPADPASFQPRHTLGQRVVMAVNILVVMGCLAGAVGLLYGKNLADNTLVTQQVEVVKSTVAPATTIVGSGSTLPGSTVPVIKDYPAVDPDAVNFLIVGSDANPCVDPDSQWAGAADPKRDGLGSRSDSIMVMRLDPGAKQAAILSFPRDLWVKVGSSNARLNSAYVENDYTLLAQTMFDSFGIVVDHYLQIDFCAFKTIVDAVGGVAVPFKTRIVDSNVDLDVAAGCHTFSGDEALAYVRSRHLKSVDANGKKHEDRAADFGRISRQQDFMRRMLQKALEKGFYDLDVAGAMVESLQKYVVRDSGIGSLADILGFAGVMRDIDPLNIRTYQVESTGLTVGGNSVRKPALKGDNMKAILAIFQGKASLAGAPVQAFETTTTTAAPSTTVGTSTTGTTPGSTIPGGTTTTGTNTTTTTIAEPTENVLGDIVPDETVQC